MMEDFLREQIEHGEHDILSNLAILKLCVRKLLGMLMIRAKD